MTVEGKSWIRKEKLKEKQPKRWRREKRMKKNIANELMKMKKEWGVSGGGRGGGKQMENKNKVVQQRTSNSNTLTKL